MTNKAFFVDQDGNEIYDEKIGSHVALAIEILEKDENLKNEYESEENRGMSTANFLQDKCGYMRGSEQGEYKMIIFDSSKLSDSQRMALRGYHEEGYHFVDSYLEELKQKQEEKRKRRIEEEEER